MNFEKNILVVDRITLVMSDEMVTHWGEAANANRERTAVVTAIILAKLQQAISFNLFNQNPEACIRGDVLWTGYGSISTTGLFAIASSADDEALNCLDDSDYLCHLRTIQATAKEHGFNLTIDRLQDAFPITGIEVPLSLKTQVGA